MGKGVKMEGVGVLANETGRLSKFDFHREGAGSPCRSFTRGRDRKLYGLQLSV